MRLRLLKAVLFATALFMLAPTQAQEAQNQIIPDRETIMINEAELQAGFLIDSNVSLMFVIGTRITCVLGRLEGGINGDLAGTVFINTEWPEFPISGTELEYCFSFNLGGEIIAVSRDIDAAESFLQNLGLTLGTDDPPETVTVTVTMRNDFGEDIDSVDYTLVITDLNDTPTLTVLLDDPIRVNAVAAVAATVVATADPIETGQAMELLSTVVGMVTVNGVELPGESIGDLLTDHSFTLGGAVGRAREVVFQATPRFPNTGSVQFEVSARDDEGAVSSTAAFTLIVGSAAGLSVARSDQAVTTTTDTFLVSEGVQIDPGITVAFAGGISSVRVTLTPGANGSLEGPVINNVSSELFDLTGPSEVDGGPAVEWQYVPTGGSATASAVQVLLRGLRLMLGIAGNAADPPDDVTMTVTVRSEGTDGSSDVSVDYTLVITDFNAAPQVETVLQSRLEIVEDSSGVSTPIAVGDPVESGQRITGVVFVQGEGQSTQRTTVNGVEVQKVEDLLSQYSFTVAGDGRTIIFSATPRPNLHGSVEFLTVGFREDTGAVTSFLPHTFVFTLIVSPMNDPPVLGAIENIGIIEDSGAFAPTAVTTADPVEAGQAIDPAIAFEVTELTVRGDGGGSSIGDLLSPLLFSPDGDGRTVLFAATPVADRYGTAVFTVTVSDTGTPAASSAFAFTLAVEAVNDAPVITVAEDSRVLELVGGEQRGVVAELSDVDVSAADGNPGRFAQPGDSMVFRLPESVTDVALRLRADLVNGNQVSLDGGQVATVQGDGGVLTTLTFTANLTADQVEALIAAVEVSADPAATAGSYELSITLTTDFNDGVVRQQEDRRPLTATAMAEVSVGRRAVLTVSFDPAAIALPADRERAVRLSVDPVPINSETITVMLGVESGTANAVSLPISTVVFDSDQSATEVVVRVAAGVERNTTARVTIDASVTVGNVQASAGNSLLVRVVSGVLLRIRTFLEGALQ